LQTDRPPAGLGQSDELRRDIDADNLSAPSIQGLDVTTWATPDVQHRPGRTTYDAKIHLVRFGQPSVNVEEIEATIAGSQLGSEGHERTNHARLLGNSRR
jgi:hypothetical protein